MNAKHIELLEQARAHYAADMLLKGTYADENETNEFRGCSVGCHVRHIHHDMTTEELYDLDGKHKIVADYYSYPEWLAHLQDTIFEGLPNGESAKWHVQMAEALASRNGVINWQETLHRVHVGILRISYRTAGSAREAVQRVIDLHERAVNGEVSEEDWSAARSAAWSAARSAAWSAAESAARSAAWSAAESAAESAARSAAESAARSAAWSAAESAAWSAAWSAAESAAWSAARSAAFQEIRDAVLVALNEPST